MIQMHVGHNVKYPLFLSYFNETWFSRHIFQNYSNYMKIRRVGAELFHVDGRTDGQT
jgi:hypothetical protein